MIHEKGKNCATTQGYVDDFMMGYYGREQYQDYRDKDLCKRTAGEWMGVGKRQGYDDSIVQIYCDGRS